MKLQKLLSHTRKAIEDYEMIENGDKIAIGISGGKDSLTLLYAMAKLKDFYPKKFDLIAITVDLGIPGFDTSEIAEFCSSLDIPYFVEKTEIYDIIFRHRKEKNPCSLCATLRKGALNKRILELGCNKTAYAHHKDDMIETFFMSLIFEGRIHTFSPVTKLDKSNITVIRPLIYANEGEVRNFCSVYRLPVVTAKCPADGYTKRQYVKELIRKMNYENPGCRDRFFTAISNGNLPGWEKEQDAL